MTHAETDGPSLTPPPGRRRTPVDSIDERCRAFVENSSEGIWRLDLDPPLDTSLPVEAQVAHAYAHGRLAECNDVMARMCGLATVDEFVGKTIEFILPASDPRARACLASIIESGYRVNDLESVSRDANGSARHFSSGIAGVVVDGLLHGLWGTRRDITGRRNAELALQECEDRFRRMADAAPVLLWMSDALGATWFNAPWLAFVGRTLDQERGSGWTVSVHPDDLATALDTPAEASQQQQPFTIEYRLRRHDGEYRWVMDKGLPLHSGEGLMLGYIRTCVDITDQKEAVAAQAYLAAIIESADDAIIAKDLNGIIRSCNAAAERIFGYPAAELIGRPVRMLIPMERQAEEDEILARIRQGEPVAHFETIRIRKDRQYIDISLTVSPVKDGAGRIIGVSKIARDISDRRRLEREYQASARERERLLEAERTARGEAERASRVKDEFVAMVSHELRTPLNAILGWTQLMMRSPEPATIERGLDVISRNTRLQSQLISDLLDISRIISGKLQLEMRVIDLQAAVRDVVETMRHDADAKSIGIQQDFAAGTGRVAADPGRLQQVLWNLLSNALKFTPVNGRVTVTLRQVEGNAELRIADTGVGIRPDVLPHVFERFHQADRSITRRFGGLGLGLSIVKHLVEMHGGTVEAASAGEGLGATFTVTLPAAMTTAGDEASRALSKAHPYETVSFATMHVLLVEDEPDTREFVRRLLETHGAVVDTAGSAVEALDRFRESPPDILISDIGLPEVDGYDLMQRIRQGITRGNTVPAIALTAYARAEDRTRALLAGYQAHIAKPVEPGELIANIASFAGLIDAHRKGL